MPTIRLTQTRISTDTSWQWEDSDTLNAIVTEETFCTDNYSMVVNPPVTVSDTERYQDFVFPNQTQLSNYIELHYNDESYVAPMPDKAGITTTITFF